MGYEIAEYPIKLNGVLYRVGDKIPTLEATPVAEKIENEKKYSRSEIQLMKVEDLKTLAEAVGIANAKEMSGANLKKALLEHYKL